MAPASASVQAWQAAVEAGEWGLFALHLQPRDGGVNVHLDGRFTDAATYRSGPWRYVLDQTSVPPQASPPTRVR